MSGPLKGLKVLDMSRVMAGPWCTQILSDLGAEVIKIERPGTGDDTRHWGPPWLKDKDGNDTREASYYMSANRGKKSVAIDIGTPEGAELVRELAAKADIFVENFKVGGLAKKGLAYDDLKAENPALIYVSITGFGQTGPMASQPGYDYLVQAIGGLMSITGVADGEPGAGPQRVGMAVGDLTSGMYATIGVLAALHHRTNTGLGQYIDLALLDTQVGWLANQAQNYFLSGKSPVRTGAWHPNLAPYQPFNASDGPVIIAVGNDGQFAKLCAFIGKPGLATDERFAITPSRNANRAVLADEIQAVVAQHPRAYWLENLPAQGVPCSPINNIEQTFAEPQVQHRGMKIDLPHTLAGTAPGIANPLNFSETPIEYTTAPPLLGEHTDEVLRAVLGQSEDDIATLHDQNIVSSATSPLPDAAK
jgi:crotonobetainyl-CoA:carnitine CoA-transferase CaiB-like acyl-CoA transferase